LVGGAAFGLLGYVQVHVLRSPSWAGILETVAATAVLGVPVLFAVDSIRRFARPVRARASRDGDRAGHPRDSPTGGAVSRLHNGYVHVSLIVLAIILSFVDGWLNLLSVLVFSGHESTRMWSSIELPAALWVPAVCSYWFPRTGLSTYAVILGASILLCVNPFHNVNVSGALFQCSDDRRFALDHFETKLLRLTDGLMTAKAQRIGERRIATMRAYLDLLREEIAPGQHG